MSGILPPDCCKLAKNPKKDDDVTIFQQTSSSIFFDVVLFLLSSLVAGPSFMLIPSLVLELWQFSFIRNWPEIRKSEIPLSSFFPIFRDWGKLRIQNLARMSLIECYWMLQNARVTAFTVFKLSRENQLGGKITPPTTQIRLMNLSKAYNCLPHDLLISKLASYGFGSTALALIGSTFNWYLEILKGIPQGSILRPILFNLIISDLTFFIKETEVCNFVDNAAIYSCSLNYEETHWKLSNDIGIVLNWIQVNGMVTNPGKLQIMFLGSLINNSNITFIVENKHVKSTNEVNLLGITIDCKLSFIKHINNRVRLRGWWFVI